MAHLWWFGVWGFGVGVLYWVFGVEVFSWWGLGPVVWGLLGFLVWGSLYKHERITLGKKMVPPGLAGVMIWYYYKIISYSHTFPIQHYIIWYPTIPIPCHHFPGIVSLRYYVILSYQLSLLFLLSVRLSFKWVHASFNSSNQQGYQASWYCLPHHKSIGVLNIDKNIMSTFEYLWYRTDHYSEWGCNVPKMRLQNTKNEAQNT